MIALLLPLFAYYRSLFVNDFNVLFFVVSACLFFVVYLVICCCVWCLMCCLVFVVCASEGFAVVRVCVFLGPCLSLCFQKCVCLLFVRGCSLFLLSLLLCLEFVLLCCA